MRIELIKHENREHPRWDSNPQSSAPETDALSIRPLGPASYASFALPTSLEVYSGKNTSKSMQITTKLVW